MNEKRPGSAPVCILSHDLWKQRFGSDSKIVGNTVTLNGEMWTVVGVMPTGFRFPQNVDLWVPAMVRSSSKTRGAQHYLGDRKSTRLHSSHLGISYAVF